MAPTLHIPLLPAATSLPAPPSSLKTSGDSLSDMDRVLTAVTKARRIVVVCGAGISVNAGIPDFRSTDGIFSTLKRDNPALSSGKDLFSATVFQSDDTTKAFNTMIGHLAQQAAVAQATGFHRLLKTLDEKGKLLRVYTQNIDCLEEQAGLTYGIPTWNERRGRSQKNRKDSAAQKALSQETGFLTPPSPGYSRETSAASSSAIDSHSPSPAPASGSSSRSTSTTAAPRCIPLHGHVKTMYCPRCSHTTPLSPFVGQLSSGSSVVCSSCEDLESTRRLVGKRGRGIGSLRPSVVLYGEAHREGEVVGECVRRDLLGIQGTSWMSVADDSPLRKKGARGPATSSNSRRKPDLLIVAGTSLKVPGTKGIVRQFAKSIRAASAAAEGSPGPSSSSSDEEFPVQTIFVNFDFPVPAREWESIFDVWLQGDVQSFATEVHARLAAQQEAARAREELRAVRAARKLQQLSLTGPDPFETPTKGKKRKLPEVTPPTKSKRAKSPAVRIKKPERIYTPPAVSTSTVSSSASVQRHSAPPRGGPKIQVRVAPKLPMSTYFSSAPKTPPPTIRIKPPQPSPRPQPLPPPSPFASYPTFTFDFHAWQSATGPVNPLPPSPSRLPSNAYRS